MNENEPGLKVNKYYQKSSDGKLLLRRVLENYVPSTISNSAKQGFSAPDASWFKGDSMNYVRQKFIESDARIYDILDRDSICSLIEEHISGNQNRRLLIWSLLSVEEWLCNLSRGGYDIGPG